MKCRTQRHRGQEEEEEGVVPKRATCRLEGVWSRRGTSVAFHRPPSPSRPLGVSGCRRAASAGHILAASPVVNRGCETAHAVKEAAPSPGVCRCPTAAKPIFHMPRLYARRCPVVPAMCSSVVLQIPPRRSPERSARGCDLSLTADYWSVGSAHAQSRGKSWKAASLESQSRRSHSMT